MFANITLVRFTAMLGVDLLKKETAQAPFSLHLFSYPFDSVLRVRFQFHRSRIRNLKNAILV